MVVTTFDKSNLLERAQQVDPEPAVPSLAWAWQILWRNQELTREKQKEETYTDRNIDNKKSIQW